MHVVNGQGGLGASVLDHGAPLGELPFDNRLISLRGALFFHFVGQRFAAEKFFFKVAEAEN